MLLDSIQYLCSVKVTLDGWTGLVLVWTASLCDVCELTSLTALEKNLQEKGEGILGCRDLRSQEKAKPQLASMVLQPLALGLRVWLKKESANTQAECVSWLSQEMWTSHVSHCHKGKYDMKLEGTFVS